jgi:ABC-2 type transport system permease protein
MAGRDPREVRRRDPLLPNAAIIARREYRDRVRGPIFVATTILLMILALFVALSPVVARYFERHTVARIVVVSSDNELGGRAVGVANSLLNIPPEGADPSTWQEPYAISLAPDAEDAERDLTAGRLTGIILVERLPTNQLDVVFRTTGATDGVRSQLVGFAAIAVGILDWTAELPPDSQLGAFQTPAFRVDQVNAPTDGGQRLDPQQTASRAILGAVFVVLLFLSVMIYGMWVAAGVAAEKSSRVMELMISAASTRQLLAGKVIGIGLAGLTQYLAIVLPALLVLAFQEPIARQILGPSWAAGTQLVTVTPPILAGYGVFFLLGFTLFALIYAAMGSFVSRTEDIQMLSLPMSLIAMAGYLLALAALFGGSGGTLVRIGSFLPPFSPFVMLARFMVAAVQPWELALSIGLLVASIAVVAAAATRMYAAGVLLYGQRPGLRAFIAAARRAG